LTDQAMT